MAASDEELGWLKASLLEYLRTRENAPDAAAEALGGASIVQQSLDDWAYRTGEPLDIYIRTIFVWERLLAGRSIDVAALDRAWLRANELAGQD